MDNKPHIALAKLAKTYGPILSLKLGQVTTIVVSSADMAKEILQTHDSLLSDRTVPHALTAFNHDQFGVGFLPLSPLWREMRRVCKNQLFSNKSLDANQYLRRHKIDELINYVSQCSLKGEAIDIGSVAFKTSINLLSNTIFSIDFANISAGTNDNKENKDLVINMAKTVGVPNMSDFFPLLRLIDPQGIKKTYLFYIGKLFSVFDNIIDQRLKLRNADDFVTNNDMLDSLLSLLEENPKEMDKEKMEHLLHDLLVGGTDTRDVNGAGNLENGMKPEEIDMEGAIDGLALKKCESLRVIPTKISN
ncbi:hypothetical protein P8452_40553 [Trifolium repens]|nr:hypothetical protein P8452_40553 [Trifolium repens]